MQDISSMVAEIRRPKLLVQAALCGLGNYRREAHLPRLLRAMGEPAPRPGAAIMRLLEIEAGMDRARRTRAGDYRIARHVAVLVALLGEARLMRALAQKS